MRLKEYVNNIGNLGAGEPPKEIKLKQSNFVESLERL
jgi:hypothetical protein